MADAARPAGAVTSAVRRLVPDFGYELTSALNQVEELLLEAAGQEDEDPETAWPPPLAGEAALVASLPVPARKAILIPPAQSGGPAGTPTALLSGAKHSRRMRPR